MPGALVRVPHGGGAQQGMTSENLHLEHLGHRQNNAFLASKHQGKQVNISIDPVTFIGLIFIAGRISLTVVLRRKK